MAGWNEVSYQIKGKGNESDQDIGGTYIIGPILSDRLKEKFL